ncbi:MAG: hypothetical protein AAF921_20875 [Cyanobacteria bacterium P01_D01_bin.44]
MRSIKSPSPFNLILTAVLSLNLASGGTAVHLASQPTLTEPQERILDSAIAICTMGTTTLFGLLSRLSDDDDDDSENETEPD